MDEGLTLAHLKGTMLHFFRELLGKEREILLQPHFFPFTEPSVDIQVSYTDKNGRPAWLELAGAGMVDPNVLERLRHRRGALHRLRVRLRPRPHRDDPLRRPRPAPLLRERPALPGAVRVRVPLSWLRGATSTRAARRGARAPRCRAAGRWSRRSTTSGVPDTNGNLGSFRVGPRAVGRAAPERRPPARVPRRPRRGRARGHRLRRAQRRRRPDRGGGAAGRPAARRREAPRRGEAARGREPRDDPLRPRARPGRRPLRDHGAARGARPGHPARRGAAAGRDRPRAGDHLQPAGLPGGVRRRARGARRHRRRRWRRSTSPTRRRRGTGDVRDHAVGGGPRPRPVPALHGPRVHWTCASARRPPGSRGAWRPPACGPSTTSWTSPTT